MVVFTLLTASLNYLYQLSMSFLLVDADYGTFASLSSMFTIILALAQCFQMSVAKFTSRLRAQDKWCEISYLWKYSLRRAFLMGIVAFSASVLLTSTIVKLLNINNGWYPVILFSSLSLVFTLSANNGVLQGLSRFFALGSSNVLWAFSKLGIGVLLVRQGLGLYGGFAAYFVASVASLVLTFIVLADLAKTRTRQTELGTFGSYTANAFLAILSFAVLTNADVILVKHYFDPETAGYFSVVSILAKVALYAPTGVSTALFPKTAGSERGQAGSSQLFRLALVLVLGLGGGVVLFYQFFSSQVVSLLYGSKYPYAASLLFEYSFAMMLFSASFLMMNYSLSRSKTRITYLMVGATVLEIGLIIMFHSSIKQVIDMILVSSCVCAVLLFIFCSKTRKSEADNI